MLRFLHSPLIWVLIIMSWAQAQAGETRQRVAVLPFTAMAAPPADSKRLRNQLTGMLNKLFDIQIVEQKTTNQAVRRLCGKRPAWWDCLGKDENLFKLGATMKVKTVVVGRLAAVGKRRVLKLRLADVSAGRVSAEVVNIPAGQEEAVLSRFVMVHKQWFGGRPEPPPQTAAQPVQQPPARSWYQKWEVWTIVAAGAAVVAGAVLFATMYSPEEAGGPWDQLWTLP